MVTVIYSSKPPPKRHVTLINGDCALGKEDPWTSGIIRREFRTGAYF